MESAKLIQYGDSQAVILPDKFRLRCDKVVVQPLGPSLLLTPTDKIDDSLLCGKLLDLYVRTAGESPATKEK